VRGGLGGLEAFVSGENCNSVAWTILTRAGVPRKKPGGLHPGWGHLLGDLKKQGAQALPPKEDNTGGQATTLAGDGSTQVQVYADRGLIEKLLVLPGATPVHLLAELQGRKKVRFGTDDTVGWVGGADVATPVRPGRTFYVNAPPNALVGYLGQDMTQYFADGGHPIVVLDPSFTVGGSGEVEVRYTDPWNKTYEGMIDAKYLTDQAPPTGDGSDTTTTSVSDSGSDTGTGTETATESEEDHRPPPGKVVVGEDSSSEDHSELSDVDESGEEAEPVVVGWYVHKYTAEGIPMYLPSGDRDPRKGMKGGQDVGATGKVRILVDGRTMVEYVSESGIRSWMTEREWERHMGAPYPAR
jgi:hypothetical protein